MITSQVSNMHEDKPYLLACEYQSKNTISFDLLYVAVYAFVCICNSDQCVLFAATLNILYHAVHLILLLLLFLDISEQGYNIAWDG